MPRHQFTDEERRKGGKTRAAQPSMQEARSRGFEVTCERHPFFARHYLKQIIHGTYQGNLTRAIERDE